jgi:hypothetical protein
MKRILKEESAEAKEIAYYKDFPEDSLIQDLDTLTQKIEAEFGCVYLCLNGIASPIKYLMRESIATQQLRLYKGLLNECISNMGHTIYYFDKIGSKINSLNTIRTALKNCEGICEDAKKAMVKISSLDLTVVQYRSEEERKADETFLQNCKDNYWGFIHDVKMLNEKIAAFNTGKSENEQLTLINI